MFCFCSALPAEKRLPSFEQTRINSQRANGSSSIFQPCWKVWDFRHRGKINAAFPAPVIGIGGRTTTQGRSRRPASSEDIIQTNQWKGYYPRGAVFITSFGTFLVQRKWYCAGERWNSHFERHAAVRLRDDRARHRARKVRVLLRQRQGEA